MKQTAALLLVMGLSSVAFGTSKAYDVVPYGDCVAEIVTSPNNGIMQFYRNTLDSITKASVWIGDTIDTSSFNIDVLDSAMPTHVLAYRHGVKASQCWAWLNVDLEPDQVNKPLRGRTYKVNITRNNHPISFAYDPRNPYTYGKAVAAGTSMPENSDLALRVYGLHDAVDSTWRACTNHGDDPRPGGQGAEIALAKAKSMGVKWLRDDFLCWGTWADDTDAVMAIYNRYVDSGFSLIGNLSFGRDVESISSGPAGAGSLGCYPPRNLYADVNSDTNWWAGYCRSIMGSLDSVRYWEVFPEAHGDWFWKDPDIAWYQGSGGPYDTIDTPRERCSLYVRMCVVAESVAQELGGSQKILGGGTSRVLDWGVDSLGDTVWVSGGAWLRLMFDLAEHSYGGVENCFDIVSVHAYMHYDWGHYFIEDVFDRSLDTARSVMREAGYPGMELWATEYGWPRWNKIQGDPPPPITPVTDSLMQARDICQFYTSAIARQADPRGGYDRAIHYELTSYHVSWNWENDGWGFLDSVLSQPLMPQGWAFKQACDALTGKRLNGRVTTSDSSVRVYEFEDPADSLKTWVCWQNGGGGQDAAVQLPARSDSAYIEMLAYQGGTPPNDMRQANSYGWLGIGAGDRPQFVTEPPGMPISRPDLVVDSIMVPVGAHVWSVMDIHAFVRNIGTDTTPDVVALDFLCDTTAFITHATSEWRIPPGGSYEFSFEINPIPGWMHGWHLFSARVNHGQTYVEKDGMDDNAGYARRYIAFGPGGDLIGELYGSHSNEPLPLFGLETHSYESDTLGSVPAESARLVQWAYGNDTIVDGGDTTAWFCVNQAVSLDTTWAYLSGQSKYRFFIQVKDSWSESELIPDTVHPYVVFDTTAPTGSIVINSGARFVAGSSCTLRISAQDSLSSIAWMRLLNVPPANLVSDGGFVGNGGSWVYENGGYDDSLGLGWLTAAPAPATVTQFIPADSISAHAGDSCVLEASIMAHVHEDDAVGSASFWYLSTNVNPQITDTLWQLVDSAGFSGNLLSLTGRYALSKHFLLTMPAADTNWVWQGGMVKVEAGAENGNGTVYVDNAALIPYEAGSGYAWWANYDTLVDWTITSGAGPHAVRVTFIDSAGNWNATPYADTVILDPTPPVVDISMPTAGLLVNGLVEITGVAYDTVEVPGDSWFQRRALSYRHWDSTNWLPVSPDSTSGLPAWPDSGSSQGPAVHLGNWNTLPLPDGPYNLLLTACDSAGNASSCTTWVMVDHGFGGGGMRSGPEGGGSGMGEGSVFVGSATGTVLHLSEDLDSLDAFSVDDSGSQANITAIVEVGEDSILILDAHNKRVHKLHRSGQHRRRLVSGLSQPVDLKRDSSGNFWLVDRGWNRIGKFRSNGTLVFVRGGLGADSLHFHSPEGIAVKGGLVYVADAGNNRICVWDTSGHFKTTITGDFENPTAVWVSDAGAIYLTDGTDGKLKGITPLGGNIVSIGTTDSSKLKGLVPSENRHSLFSLASEPNKVYKLRIQSDESRPGGAQSGGRVNLPKTLALNQPFPNPARTRLNIAYALPRQTRVELKLYDVAGKLVKAIVNSEQKPGYYTLTWNRQDTKGRTCACGVYFCTLAAENQRFSRKVILTE